MAGTRSGVTVAAVRRIALALPGVEEGLSYGTPGFRVRGKFLARLWEDGDVLVVKCGDTEHYRGYPTVLVRLARVRPDELRDVLAEAWRRAAPKRLVDEYEAGPRSRSPARRAPRTARRSPRP